MSKLDLTGNAMFLGATRAMVPDVDLRLPEPKRDNRCGDEKWATKKVELKEKSKADSAHWPMTGYILELALIDWSGEPLLEVQCQPGETYTTGVHLFALLNSNPAMIPQLVQAPRTCIPVRWFGFDIRTTLSMLAMEVMTYNSSPKSGELPEIPGVVKAQAAAHQPIPWHVWWHHHFTTLPYLDPFDMMIPSTVRSKANFQPSDLARQFGLQANPAYGPARQQAEFARDLVRASGALAGLPVPQPVG